MSFTDRLSLGHRHRVTGSLEPDQAEANGPRRQTAPFIRGTGSLSLSGETEFDQSSRELTLDSQTLALVLGMTDLMQERRQRGTTSLTGSSPQQPGTE